MSNEVSLGKKDFKYFIGYKDAKVGPLCIFLPKMIIFSRDFDETEYVSFMIKDDELLEKYNEVWIKLKIVLKNNLIVNQYTMKNI